MLRNAIQKRRKAPSYAKRHSGVRRCLSDMFMFIIRTFEITNRLGIHARVAAKLVETANRFKAEVSLEKDGVEVNGRSILSILALYCPQGSRLTICTEGVDAQEAMAAFALLIADKFGET